MRENNPDMEDRDDELTNLTTLTLLFQKVILKSIYKNETLKSEEK